MIRFILIFLSFLFVCLLVYLFDFGLLFSLVVFGLVVDFLRHGLM